MELLIEQCQVLESVLQRFDGRLAPAAPLALHQFFIAMQGASGPLGVWSVLALSLLIVTGGLGLGIGVTNLLVRYAGSPALAAAALMLICALVALLLVVGITGFMRACAAGIVLLKRLAQALMLSGLVGLAGWLTGNLRAVGPVIALLSGLGAWLVMNSEAFHLLGGYQMALSYLRASEPNWPD